MQITVTISDGLVYEAQEQGMATVDYVESLIDKGRKSAAQPQHLETAIERIRALRSSVHPMGK
jgi:hypothetical protein